MWFRYARIYASKEVENFNLHDDCLHLFLPLLQKAQALQRQHEERERLARIERESRPITVHGVREKLRPKLPYWKQKQLESSLDRGE